MEKTDATARNTVDTSANIHYDEDYFKGQRVFGEFSGWAELFKFKNLIGPTDTVIDFGCGGGYVLNNINCQNKIGIELNPSAAESVNSFKIKHFFSSGDALRELGEGVADVIISNHALEHVLNPLGELRILHRLLKRGGRIHFVVPCESIKTRYNPNDINHHLFTWSPQNLGHLFTEAGFNVLYSKSLIHTWPPFAKRISILGWPIFNIVCNIFGWMDRSKGQVIVNATKLTD